MFIFKKKDGREVEVNIENVDEALKLGWVPKEDKKEETKDDKKEDKKESKKDDKKGE